MTIPIHQEKTNLNNFEIALTGGHPKTLSSQNLTKIETLI